MSTVQDNRAEAMDRLKVKLRRELGRTVMQALDDPDVIEVMLNPDGRIWLDVMGKGMVDSGDTLDEVQAMNALGTIAASLGKVVNYDSPIIEGQLILTGSRFEGLIPPVTQAPCFAIRKHASKIFTLEEYVRAGIASEAQAAAIRQAVADRQNILIAGSTSSGKTTLGNAVLHEIARCVGEEGRVLLIEDTPELQCAVPNKVTMWTSPGVDMTTLLRATMRLAPHRIVVGEVRGSEALTLLKSWNTGHPGGCATLHANSASAALTRIEMLVQEANVPPQPHLVAEAVNMIIFIEKCAEGRRIKEIVKVCGYKDGEYLLEPV